MTNELRPDTPPRQPARPRADPSTPGTNPRAPQTGPVDEVEALYSRPGSNNRQGTPNTASKTKKWQPLTAVAPHPETDNGDPFSLGDSDDEQHDAKTKDIRAEDTERLKKAAGEAGQGDDGGKAGGLQPSERAGSTGTRDKEAEELLTTKA